MMRGILTPPGRYARLQVTVEPDGLEIKMESLPAQLTQLESAQLVRRLAEEELAYFFKHALTQEATYESMLLKKRRELHQRIAQVYEALDPKRMDEYAALLVYHYKESGDHAKVFEYAVRAGASAANLSLIALAEKAGDFFYLCFPSAFQALIMSRTGQNEVAEAELARAKSIRERVGGRILFDDWIAAIDAEIALNAKRADKAQVLAEQAIRVARSVDSIFAEGWAQRVWGQALAKDEGGRMKGEADSHFAESLRLFEAGDVMPDAARTHVAWGEMLMRRGQKPRALEHFRQAAI